MFSYLRKMDGKLIAESGGSKTDWALLKAGKITDRFTTLSYHPRYWTPDFIETQKVFWKNKANTSQLDLKFYGAGCHSLEIQQLGIGIFNSLGFKTVEVKSDLEAAAISAFQELDGRVVIMGTGSVIFDWINSEVKNLRGGFGYLLEDFGSGFHFGKMLLLRYFENDLSEPIKEIIQKRVGSEAVVKQEIYANQNLGIISELAMLLPYGNNVETDLIHKENIALFYEKYLKTIDAHLPLAFCGSYAFYCQDLIRRFIGEDQFQNIGFIKSPIENLILKA